LFVVFCCCVSAVDVVSTFLYWEFCASAVVLTRSFCPLSCLASIRQRHGRALASIQLKMAWRVPRSAACRFLRGHGRQPGDVTAQHYSLPGRARNQNLLRIAVTER